MSLSKSIARKVIFPFITGVGIDKLFLMKARKKSIIINFHGVTSVIGNRFNNRHFDVSDFEKTLVYLKHNFNIVSLSEIFKNHQSGVAPQKKTVALTFDDGYLNNFTVALPILKKHNIPATFYLISKGLQDDSYYVWPDIVDLIQKNIRKDIILNSYVFKFPGFYCEELDKSLVDFIKSSGYSRDTYINELALAYPYYKTTAKQFPELIELIRKDDFSKYSQEPLIEYGSHTHAHYNLEYLTDEESRFEMGESKRIIVELTGKKVISIAFPDGSYSKRTLELAKEAGYENLVAVEYKFKENNQQSGLLSRFTISNSTTPESNMLRLAMQFDKYAF
ncbi:MAG: polysaccharide deacetylase family protein [Bacteroidia bacterium]|nr:polysaccharide deacetylase family protein [Bacteroidia bacterium]